MGNFGTVFRPLELSGYRTGALDISLRDRRVISIPSQLGCRVGCTFCVSKSTPLVRNLKVHEMVALVRLCLEQAPPDERPIELSFTGEGEAVLNWRACMEVCLRLPTLSRRFDSVRYCFSGFGASRLLHNLDSGPYPMRLQLSLHSTRQELRSRLIPRSEPLSVIHSTMTKSSHHFASIELNVVLQDGINDSSADLASLAAWGDTRWPILLNPLLADGREVAAARTDVFEAYLQRAGRDVRRYTRIAERISRVGIYPRLTATKLAKGAIESQAGWREKLGIPVLQLTSL
jgi:adenine C2-methylase RlmN of 23S rRNA A2503 and tRNA A37